MSLTTLVTAQKEEQKTSSETYELDISNSIIEWEGSYSFLMTSYQGLVQFSSGELYTSCLLYTSPSPRDRQKSRMPSSA